MVSDLYKIGRLVTNGKFVTIVEAAMLKHAQTIPLGGTLTTEKNFAIWVLKNPMQPEVSMNALVASDPTVLGSVTINDDLVNVESMNDADVSAVVSAKWSIVSTKYPIINPQ